MAFAIRNLSVLAYAQGFTLWHYKAGATTKDQASVPGFFNDAEDMLAAGDMMMLTASDGGRIVCIASANQGVTTAPIG